MRPRDPTRLLLTRLGRRDGDEWFHLEEALLPHAADVHQVLDLLEAAVLLPVVDDALRHLRPDTGNGGELLGGCGVQVDRCRGCRRGRCRGPRRRGFVLRACRSSADCDSENRSYQDTGHHLVLLVTSLRST